VFDVSNSMKLSVSKMILINHIFNIKHHIIINAKGTITYFNVKVLLFLSITSDVLCDAALGEEGLRG
jgi:hypothetical protein